VAAPSDAAAPLSGIVVALFACARGGEPMVAHASLRAVAGVGIEGDRYARGAGHWSFDPRYESQITLVEAESLEAVASALGRPFGASDSRRNVVTRGIALECLIGRRFTIGEALFVGERACDPCAYLDGLIGLPVRAQLEGRGGLRAAILRSGVLSGGATIAAEPAPAGRARS
jgi:MOSC domain-containing protein YiiM